MPPFMRYRGWWGMMQLYNPEADIGNPDGNIYSGGIDTVFLRDIDKLEAAFNAVDADIVGVRCPNRGGFNSMLLRIRKGSPGALRVWNAATSSEKYHPRMVAFEGMEHKFVRGVAADYIGVLPDEYTDSYKLHVGLFPEHARKPQDIDKISALFFHGRPRPLDVCENPGALMRDVVVENWGRHIGFEGRHIGFE
jgi:hypothetical protein